MPLEKKCSLDLFLSAVISTVHPNNHSRNIETMGTAKERNKEMEKLGALSVAVGVSMSPTFSLRKDPNLDVFAKT